MKEMWVPFFVSNALQGPKTNIRVFLGTTGYHEFLQLIKSASFFFKFISREFFKLTRPKGKKIIQFITLKITGTGKQGFIRHCVETLITSEDELSSQVANWVTTFISSRDRKLRNRSQKPFKLEHFHGRKFRTMSTWRRRESFNKFFNENTARTKTANGTHAF